MPDAEARFRIEHDTLGEMKVPATALYGAQTARAVANFPISGWRMPRRFLTALATVKAAFARAHGELGLLPHEIADAVTAAADEVADGLHLGHFPIDVFQTGSGTSTNMNMNEVLAHLANRRLGGDPASNSPVHPNDHVNKSQSSNDVIPATLRLAAIAAWNAQVRPAVDRVVSALRVLAERYRATVTLGRTHLMDAVPTTYGRVFDAWARRLEDSLARGDVAAGALSSLPLGGTAVGSGLGANQTAVARVAMLLTDRLEHPLSLDSNPAVGIQAQDGPIAYADALAGVGRVLMAVANDVRLRSSGPFGGLGELSLPAVQPGSSIMPGKVNPVIPEAVVQVAIQVEGLASACRASVALHQLDLAVANPLLAWNLDTMGHLLAAASNTFAALCLDGLSVDVGRARRHAEASPALATALAARLGYEKAAEVAKEAERTGKTVAATARRMKVLPPGELDDVLDLDRLAAAEPPPR